MILHAWQVLVEALHFDKSPFSNGKEFTSTVRPELGGCSDEHVVKTNMENYAKMRVDSYPNPINFTIVYQTDGTPIVPELPSMAVIALFLPATLLAAIVYCRRRRD